MSDSSEYARRYRELLEPFIKPREQVVYIRRILALSLEANSPDALVRRPLSLADGDAESIDTSLAKGVHKDYLEALRANAEARREFDAAARGQQAEADAESPKQPMESSDFLTERISLLRLQRKRSRLLVIKNYLDSLAEDPAASSANLDPARMFKDVPSLPDIPKEIVSSMVAAQTSEPQDLRSQAANLEKIALRARVLCKQEEQLLAQARRNAESLPEVVSNGAKMEALSATRNELINWIEFELSHAAADDQEDERGSNAENSPTDHIDQAGIDIKLDEVKKKYEKYVSARQSLLEMLEQGPQSQSLPSLRPQQPDEAIENADAPTDYLLTPYIEQLLSLSRTQKSMITQKSYIGNSLSKQAKDTCQLLGRLAEESQLLPAYPMKDSMRRRSGLQHELTGKGSGRPDVAQRIKPWVFAADSAKIASLEAVTEHVERGQISLGATMQSLEEISGLLGQHPPDKNETEASVGNETEDDVWLAGGSPAKGTGGRKHSDKAPSRVPGDPWSRLHGSLGLIGSE
ncbi:hypothetical protein NLU13_9057 [Sarocladium strictum]|uniref:Uncharacterized protein n=1 Tax=Sarocladium strictum TaxID=5046 RepID=A0AA39GA08_SARSR|nr:hypothetical protein NLU13_9057 [Sarocladium strictum]